jgi:hypothetical protein
LRGRLSLYKYQNGKKHFSTLAACSKQYLEAGNKIHAIFLQLSCWRTRGAKATLNAPFQQQQLTLCGYGVKDVGLSSNV